MSKAQHTLARTYLVGLPVAVTVQGDGTVSFTVDTTEAGAAMWEHLTGYPEDMAAFVRDVETVNLYADRHTFTPIKNGEQA